MNKCDPSWIPNGDGISQDGIFWDKSRKPGI